MLPLHRSSGLMAAALALLMPVARAQLIESEIKGFKHAFVDPASGRRTSLLSGLSATNISNEALLVIQPQLHLFSEDGTTNLTVSAADCVYNTQLKLVSSAEKLHAASSAGRFTLEGDGFQYQIAPGSLIVSNRAHAVIRKDLLRPESPAAAPGSNRQQTPTNAPSATGPFVDIYSDHLRFQTNLAVFEDDVRVSDPPGNLTCGLLTVRFVQAGQTNEGLRIDRILAEQHVVMDSEETHATGDEAIYRQATDVIELAGNPTTWRLRQYQGRARNLVVNRTQREFHAERDVEVTLPQETMGRSGFFLPGNAAATHTTPTQGRPVLVRADDFQFGPDRLDTNFNLAVFRDQVKVSGDKGNLACDRMTIKMSAASNRTESAVAERSVVMEEGDRRVTGDRAVYSAITETVDVTGEPMWRMGPREGAAELLTFDLSNGLYRATGHVRMRLPTGSFGRSPWLLPGTGTDTNPPAVTGIPSTNRPGGPIEISSDEFEFRPAAPDAKTDTADYRGQVQVKDGDRMQLSCERLTATMFSGTNQVENVVAEQNVAITIREPQGERRAHGDKAVYSAANAEVVLSGEHGVDDAGVEIVFQDPKVSGRGTGARAVYAGGPDTLDLAGNPVVTTQFGRLSGDDVVLDRANTTLQATGNWKLKLDAEALSKIAKRASPGPTPPRTDSGPIRR